MKTLIILNKGKKIPKIQNANVSTFEEEYNNYIHKCKKKMWATPEGFSLDYDSCLSDLINCIWVRPYDEDTYEYIKKFYKVIEIV